MSLAAEKSIALAQQSHALQLGLRKPAKPKPDSGGALAQGALDVGAAHHLDLQFDARMVTMKLHQKIIVQRRLDPADGEDAHLADHVILGVLEGCRQPSDIAVDLLGDAQHFFAGRRHIESRTSAQDQFAVQLLLQSLQRLADRRLSQKQPRRRPADALLLADDQEGPQQIPVQTIAQKPSALPVLEARFNVLIAHRSPSVISLIVRLSISKLIKDAG